MMFLNNLRKKSQKILQIIKDRFGNDDSDFLDNSVVNLSVDSGRYAMRKEESLFESLQNTYIDMAQSDPEEALRAIKEELSVDPPAVICDILIEIERHIRQQYCGQYFRGVRHGAHD